MDEKHPLAAYLEKTGEKQTDFARRVPISESYLSLILSWKRGVSLATAARLETATGKKVKAVELIHREVAQ